MTEIANVLMSFTNDHFAWLYLLAVPSFLFFLIGLALTKYGDVVLGKQGEKPEYTMFQWCAMLFCGGTGIGLVFWSIAEPLSHLTMPPNGLVAGSDEAAMFAIRTCFAEWGLFQWPCFTVVGLAMAYFSFKKDKPFQISLLLEPLFGARSMRFIGKIVDVFSIVVSIAGIATSLGLGCMQITGGLNYMYGVPKSNVTYAVIIVLVTIAFTISAVTGLNKGIKKLSSFNAYMAFVLLFLGLTVCNKAEVGLTLVNGIGEHLQYLLVDGYSINPYGDNEWVMNWRVFYFAWFVAWVPFVGMFFARISRGRTIREFVVGTIVMPSIFTWIWFAVFGDIAISARNSMNLERLKELASMPDIAVFEVFSQYKIGGLMSLCVVVLLATFFVTSADSATYSIAMLSDNGNPNPTTRRKIVFACIEGAVSLVLLACGGLKALQTISIVAALPFVVIMILICIALVKELRKEGK